MMARKLPLGVLQLVFQREGNKDCAIAGLATILGCSYEQVLVAAARSTKGDLFKGLDEDEMHATARRLGRRLKQVPWEKVDEDEATGLVDMQGRFNGESYEHHLALLLNGQIIDLDNRTVWKPDLFFTHYAACANELWTAK